MREINWEEEMEPALWACQGVEFDFEEECDFDDSEDVMDLFEMEEYVEECDFDTVPHILRMNRYQGDEPSYDGEML